jgi:flavin reductase (DIM6/NTAB) family NADH-FMN oxidoreductase RutF
MTIPASQRPLFAALGRIPSGLFILTAERGGQETGMLASWIQQCSFEPPQVTVAIQNSRTLIEWLKQGDKFTINILDEGQTDMIGHFGRGYSPGEPAFEGLDIQSRPEFGPLLNEALAHLDCQVMGRLTAGDHDVVVAQIISGNVSNESRPMVHVRKSGSHY